MSRMVKSSAVITKSREELLEDMTNLSLKEIKDRDAKFEQITKQLFSEADKVQASNLKVCFLLLQISDYQLWKCKGNVYQTFYDYTENNFEMSKTSLNERLLVARRFGVYTEVTVMKQYPNGSNKPVTKYAPQYKLNPNYKDFGFKQLYIMRNLSDKEIETIGIKSEMSCRDIQKAIEDYKNGLADKNSGIKKITTKRTTETENEKTVPINPPEKPKEIGKITFEELKDKPLKLPPSNGGYVILVDELGNIVVKTA